MNNVGDFLREIDTVKFDANGNFIYTTHKDYSYDNSKFNAKYRAKEEKARRNKPPIQRDLFF